MRHCNRCDEIIWSDEISCKCKPFQVVDADGEEYVFYGKHAESVAEKAAEKWNTENDHYLINQCEVITVNGQKFEICAEPDVHYTANEI